MPSVDMRWMGCRGGCKAFRCKVVKPKNTKDTFIRLWICLGTHKFLLITALFFIIINSSSSSMATYQIRPILNVLVEQAGSEVLLKILFKMFCIYLIAVISQYIQARIILENSTNHLLS